MENFHFFLCSAISDVMVTNKYLRVEQFFFFFYNIGFRNFFLNFLPGVCVFKNMTFLCLKGVGTVCESFSSSTINIPELRH